MSKKILLIILSIIFLTLPLKISASCSSSCASDDPDCIVAQAEGTDCREATPDDLPRVNTAPIVQQPAPAGPALPPTIKKPAVPYPPPKPIITCQHEGNYYYPGQKRYECFTPREQGTCNPDAGYGIPYICDGSGNWGAGNNGLAECSNTCPVETPTETYNNQSCPNIDTDTCIYRISNSDSDMCYSGTGAYGFTPDCNYSCGPVVCPVIPDSQTSTVQDNNCSGELSFACDENPSLNANWNISNKLGGNSCNVFIRDEFGDHTISNDCNSFWSGNVVPGGAQAVIGGTYELYVSNGTDSCYNKFASSTQISCESQEIMAKNDQPLDLGFIEPIVSWFLDSF